jgi:hypothetical protein
MAEVEESQEVESTRLVALMQYVEKHQSPPEKGVTQGQLIHAGYTRSEIDQANSQGYIDRLSGTSRIEYVVSGYSHGSL